MMEVSIFAPVIKKTMVVTCTVKGNNHAVKALLLGSSGEKLKTFLLTKIENVLPLDGIPQGNYSLRIESGNEVLVKQIIIP